MNECRNYKEQREIPIGQAARETVEDIVALLNTHMKWCEISPLIGKKAAELAYMCNAAPYEPCAYNVTES